MLHVCVCVWMACVKEHVCSSTNSHWGAQYICPATWTASVQFVWLTADRSASLSPSLPSLPSHFFLKFSTSSFLSPSSFSLSSPSLTFFITSLFSPFSIHKLSCLPFLYMVSFVSHPFSITPSFLSFLNSPFPFFKKKILFFPFLPTWFLISPPISPCLFSSLTHPLLLILFSPLSFLSVSPPFLPPFLPDSSSTNFLPNFPISFLFLFFFPYDFLFSPPFLIYLFDSFTAS